MITEFDINRISEKVISKLLIALREEGAPPSSLKQISVSKEQAMAMLGCNSKNAFYREARTIGLRPYVYKKYYVRDIENAVAKASKRANALGNEPRLVPRVYRGTS